jgi:tetratricopeptide (TPR) repeat protein
VPAIVLPFRRRHPRGPGAARAEAHALYLVAWGLEESPVGAEKAESIYRRVVALDPDHAPSWHNLGNLVAARSRLLESIDCYRRAVVADPLQLESRWALGMTICSPAIAPLGFDGIRASLALDKSFPDLAANAVALAEIYAHLRRAEGLGGEHGFAARWVADGAVKTMAKLEALARRADKPAPVLRRPGHRW